MAHPQHLARVHEGKDMWNIWRKHNKNVRPDLREADLRDGIYDGFDFHATDFFFSKFKGSSFRHADFSQASFNGADLSECHLEKAIFRNLELLGTSFERAVLKDCLFENTRLFQVDFSTGPNNHLQHWNGLPPGVYTYVRCFLI